MKGIVVALKGKHAILLNQKGEFIRVKNNRKFRIGYEVEIDSKVTSYNFKSLVKVLSIAAGFLLFLGIGMGAYTYNMPYNYINVDINPSMEFTVNIFGMVLDAKGLNSDGEELLKKNSYKHLKIDKAVGEFIKLAVNEGFLVENNENAVMITVSGKDYNKLSNIKKELVSTASNTLEKDKVQSEVMAEEISLTERDSAKELGISPGKLVLIEKLKEEKPDVKVDEYKEKPVKEILTSIKQAKKDIPKNKKEHNTLKKEDNIEATKSKKHNNELKGNGDVDKKAPKENKEDSIKNKNSSQKDTIAKSKKEKDTLQKAPEPKGKIGKEADAKSLGQDKAVLDTKLKDKKQTNNEPKVKEPKVNKPKDDLPKDNKPKDNKSKDNDLEGMEHKEKISKTKPFKDAENKDLRKDDLNKIENEDNEN